METSTDNDFESDIDMASGQPSQKVPEQNETEIFLARKAALLQEAQNMLQHLTEKQKFNRNDILKSFQKQFAIMSALDTLCEAIINDLQIANQRYFSLEQNLFKISQQLTVITSVLKDKAIVTDEEMVQTWENKVKPEIEQKIKEIKKKTEAPVPPPQIEPITTAQTQSADPV